MTTLYQFYKGIEDQILSNPELADYEVHFVDETTQKEVGVTPVGLSMFMGTDDERKIFDFYCNIPQDTIDEYMENRTPEEKAYLCVSPVVVLYKIQVGLQDLQHRVAKAILDTYNPWHKVF